MNSDFIRTSEWPHQSKNRDDIDSENIAPVRNAARKDIRFNEYHPHKHKIGTKDVLTAKKDFR
jgi:hypothetical protein